MSAPTEHIDDAVLRHMRDGHLAPAALLEVDEHLAECPTCRTRLARVAAEDSEHLSTEMLAELVAGTASPEDAWTARVHLAACRRCAADLDALGAFGAEVGDYNRRAWTVPRRLAAGLAAAVVVSAGVWWLGRGSPNGEGGAALMTDVAAAPAVVAAVRDGGRWLVLDASGQLTGAAGLSSADSARIASVLREAAGLAPPGSALRELSPSEAAAAAAADTQRNSGVGHLLVGALEERAGHRDRAAAEYRALVAENPGSAIAAHLLARVAAAP